MASSTGTEATPSRISLSQNHLGILHDVKVNPASIEIANSLLQKNHEEWHMFFRDRAGHNHISHSILTCLALGGSPEDIQRAYDDGLEIQRPMPPLDEALVARLGDDNIMYESLGLISQYRSFLAYFQKHMEEHGWTATVIKYLFSHTKLSEKMLARMYEGAYHPVIHLGLGFEFQQPAIVAEALAQAAAHDDSNLYTYFIACEEESEIAYPLQQAKTLLQIMGDARSSKTVRNAPHWEDYGNKMRDGVIGRACRETANVASKFVIRKTPEGLRRRTAEMIDTCAYVAASSQRPGRKRKIDFFYMHMVTSSLFFSVIGAQDWIPLNDRIRMVEWKARLDVAWYVVCGCADIQQLALTAYNDPVTDGMGWDDLYAAVVKEHDDGHVGKMIRALKNGQEAARPFENGPYRQAFPLHGDMWLKAARMTLGTTTGCPDELKFVMFTGFDIPWETRPDLQ
ncbi:hypothetical protein E4U57_002776 [Claviceps arundinis]|uniref:Oxidoreductase AflY n=1 Tax=Claviceps arundinis TaxID=1623583 RepID=A0ABQ7P7Z9_9HYPO|nr:hypothetical protein E4U57_002776 [Claviceps arundinis]